MTNKINGQFKAYFKPCDNLFKIDAKENYML